MAIGPVEYLILGFPGNQFTGEIAPAIADLVNKGVIRILDLVFITADAQGDDAVIEFDEHEGLQAFLAIEGKVGGLISQEDIEHASQGLAAGSSVALLVWEDLWAAPLADALRDAGGFVIEGSRIPHELIEPAMTALESSG
jgi:hypothetical protein